VTGNVAGVRSAVLAQQEPATVVDLPAGHHEEHCGCDYCSHPAWCGSDEHDGEIHDGVEQAPLWPCATVLAATGDPTPEAFFEREGAQWEAWARQAHPEWFGAEQPVADAGSGS
jgi:hypothetical protein